MEKSWNVIVRKVQEPWCTFIDLVSNHILPPNLHRAHKYQDVIYGIIRDIASEKNTKRIRYEVARQAVLAKGFTNNQFEETLEDYEELGVLMVNTARTWITFVQ